MAPVQIRFIENLPVVTKVLSPDEKTLEVGDVIRQLDGVEVSKLVSDWTPYYADSNEAARLRDMGISMTHGDCGKPISMGIQRGTSVMNVTTMRVSFDSFDHASLLRHDRPGPVFQKLSSDIAYLKLSGAKRADVEKYLVAVRDNRGLVIDIRNYPSDSMFFALGQHFVDKPSPFAAVTMADLLNPGAFDWGPVESLTPSSPRYQGKIAILVDDVTQSSAEYHTMAFRVAPGAAVIGSTTAGADGNVSQIPLPGALKTMISGIGVFYPDHKRTEGVGIVPDVIVKPTIAGIRAGRDEVLEAAIQYLSKP